LLFLRSVKPKEYNNNTQRFPRRADGAASLHHSRIFILSSFFASLAQFLPCSERLDRFRRPWRLASNGNLGDRSEALHLSTRMLSKHLGASFGTI